MLTNAFHDENLVGVVVQALGSHRGGDTNVITRLLITALQHPNSIIRGNAASFLAGKDAALAVPALIPILDDREFYPQDRAAIALATFGPAAKRASPKLFSLYTNVIVSSDRKLARLFGGSLLDALRNVDPDTAGKAEAFFLKNGPVDVAGDGSTATRLPNGKELITGGSFQTTVPLKTNHVFATADLLDPRSGKRTKTGSMNVAREFHTATLLGNGKVLVAGGQNLGSDGKIHRLTSAELYDPATGNWIETGSMNSPHPNQSAVLQRDGKVRVSGSEGDKIPPDDLYDPATGKWTTIPKH